MERRPKERDEIRNVVLVAKLGSPEPVRLAGELGAWLGERGVEVRFDSETSRALGLGDGIRREAPPRDADLLVVAGGDGTLLYMARAAAPLGIPILGVNLGSLGFLTELQPDELYPRLENVLRGEYTVEERRTLRCRLLRSDRQLSEHTALNDVVITKSALARMIQMDVLVDGQSVASYTSDGMIVATPTGSTAYSLSAGGPILDPRMSAVLITPICPHTMTYRPLVVPGDVKVEVRLRTATHEAVFLTLDGQVGFPLDHQDVLQVDIHPTPVRLVRTAGRGFFEVLRRKLRWGER